MKPATKTWAGSLLVLLAGFSAAGAATLRVPAQHPTIGEALAAAAAGDTVLVAPGQYKENLTLKPGTVLRSEKGRDSTVVVSPTEHGDVLKERLVDVLPGGDRATVIEGFTFQGGLIMGAGVYCDQAGITIRGNTMRALGWGIMLRSSDALVEDNIVEGCRPFGIAIFACSPEIRRNTIHDINNRGISVAGRKSKPVIGGRREYANRIFGNTYGIVNDSRNDIDAQWNDWGWATTSEMERAGYPADITVIMDGNDLAETGRGKGKVDYRNWIRPQESGAQDTAARAAAATPPARASTDSAAARPAAAPAPAGRRWLLPALLAVGLLAVFVIVSRRGSR